MKRLATYSQHFLRSPNFVAELVGHSNIRRGDIVYDLGAGSGVITSVLVRRAKQVIAVEHEPQALQKLHENIGANKYVTIVDADILDLKLPQTPYKIFSNIPFSISSSVVQKFCFSENPPRSLYLIVQKQFANKLLSSTTHFTSQLGASLAPFYSVRIRRPLKKTDFTPPPAVDTVLLEIKPRLEPLLPINELDEYRKFITRMFMDQKFYHSLDRSKLGISPETNPARLSSTQFVALYLQQSR